MPGINQPRYVRQLRLWGCQLTNEITYSLGVDAAARTVVNVFPLLKLIYVSCHALRETDGEEST